MLPEKHLCCVTHVTLTNHLISSRLVKQVVRPTQHMQQMLSIVVSQSQARTLPAWYNTPYKVGKHIRDMLRYIIVMIYIYS